MGSDYNINTSCCGPNDACMMVNTRTATCQDLSETTAYPSFTETTDKDCSNTGEVCYDSDNNINTSCCKPNLCSMVNITTATCQDLSETTAYPSFTETTDQECSNTGEVCYDSD